VSGFGRNRSLNIGVVKKLKIEIGGGGG